jgi:phosphatidylglycerophosphatase A
MNLRRWISSCFGLGFLPVAPGTWGSLPIAVIFWILCAEGTCTAGINAVMAALIFVGATACVVYGPASIAATGKQDPSEVVMDEFAGQALTYLSFFAISPHNAIFAAVLGFLLFRVLDVLKPWPVYLLEALPGGWGILADDLGAGVIGAVIFNLAANFNLYRFI